MSELKAISGHEIREDIDYNTRGIDPEDKEWCKYGKELCNTLYYRKSEADKLLAEKDKEIAELKKKLMPCLNGDCILTCEVVEKYGKENAELKQKLEDVQASMYADVVDANMKVRRLKRALYKACANWAYATIYYSGVHEYDAHKWEDMVTKCRAMAEELGGWGNGKA